MTDDAWGRVPHNIRERIRRQVFARDGYRCTIRLTGCTGRAEELDHVIPIKRGGAIVDIGNIRAACRWCNRTRYLQAEARRAARQW